MNARDKVPNLAGAHWLARAEIRAVFDALSAEGHRTRAVGGAVRDALMGRPVKDVDLATTAHPEDVMRFVRAANLTAVPTGIEHGTVTVISNGAPYEVTTLRRDIETFGRRARVTFTTDWTEDARRRDFTINALYADREGTLFDPLRGYPDLAARRVRFIGGARDRIREDTLRILRFFRFSATLGEGNLDADGLAACAALRDGLASLSGERIRAELLRLLVAPRALEAVSAMAELGILDVLFAPTLAPFRRLAEIERRMGRAPDPLLRLAALAGAETAQIAERLRLSNVEAERLAHALRDWPDFDPATSEKAAKARLYTIGPTAYAAGALLAWARSGDPLDDPSRRHRVTLPERWQAPALPFRGADVLALGIPPGPEVGRVLAAFEAWWIEQGFPGNGNDLRARLADFAARA